MKIRFIETLLLSSFCVIMTAAQTNMQDVLYLKNGSIIRGMIVQFIPDSTIKIQTADGSVFAFPSLEIIKVQKEENPSRAQKQSDSTSQKKENNVVASLFAGVAIPGSDFSNAADAGFTLGFQLHSKKEIGFLVNFSYSHNSSPADEGWATFIALAGMKVSLKSLETIDIYIAPVLGLYVQKFPIIGTTGTGLTYGGMMGFQTNKYIGFGLRYVAAKPEFNYQGYKFKVSNSMLHVFCAVNI
jgi:hypothetical protein